MASNQKLELTWLGKGDQPRLEPRLLLLEPEHCHGDPNADNILIHGDNLLALKALEQQYAGKVKCIYIDPPYNTGNAFEYYDDFVEHSIWLNLLKQRLEILRNLLSDDGFFCCQIDDSEGHYLKVLLDEIFGRSNYLTTFYVRVRYPDKTLKQDMDFHKEIEYIHIYRKKYGVKPKKNSSEKSFDKFNFLIKEIGHGLETTIGGKKVEIFSPGQYEILKGEGLSNGLKEIWATGSILDGNSSGRFFRDYLTGRFELDGYGVLYKVYGIGDDQFDFRYFTGPKKEGATKGKYFQGVPMNKLDDDVKEVFSPINNFYDLASSFGNCRTEGGVEFRSGKKPEILLKTVLFHFSNPGDLVLDSFLGSGTTAAVAHKMGRRWIGIELGEHCYTHCVPRLRKVVSGEDQGGISKAVDWKGGGGFKTYRLAPSLLAADEHAMLRFNPDFTDDMVAEAVAKIEGFTYAPDPEVFWKQSRSSEQDYLLVTKIFVTAEWLAQLHAQMAEGESLLLCCPAYGDGCERAFANISIKKIPHAFLRKYEFGKDDYSLNVQNVIGGEDAAEAFPDDAYADEDSPAQASNGKKRKRPTDTQTTLF